MSANRICTQISQHPTLSGTLGVNWLEDYYGEFFAQSVDQTGYILSKSRRHYADLCQM